MKKNISIFLALVFFVQGFANEMTKIDNLKSKPLTFNDIKNKNKLYLYAGAIPEQFRYIPIYNKFIGLSLLKGDTRQIQHDLTHPFDLPDNCVDVFQSEDVFEHIEYDSLPAVLNEIYRVLKPEGFCRISLPDYRCDYLIERSMKSEDGELLFDPGGGGHYINGKVCNGGHVWFPKIESMSALIKKTQFHTHGRVNFLQYYDEEGNPIVHPTDYSVCHVHRTPDFDQRVQNPRRPLSLVVDLYKSQQ